MIITLNENKNNGSPSLVSFSILFGLYKVFRTEPAAWIAFAILLHAINAFFVFFVSKKISEILFGSLGNWFPFFPALLFLISPYQTEAVLWQPANLPVLLAVLFFLGSLLLQVNYFLKRRTITLFFSFLFFLLAAFSYESALVLPAVSFMVFILIRKKLKIELSAAQFIMKMLIPQAGIIFLYMAASKLLFGEWLWHGGVVEIAVPFSSIAGTMLKYFAKFFLFFRYIPGAAENNSMRELFAHKEYLIAGFVMICTAAIFIFYFLKRKNNKEWIFISVLFSCFLVSLVPVLPLDSSFLNYIYPDRYGYLPSVFFYFFISSAIFFLFRKYAMPVLLGYAMLCLILLMKTIPVWISANEYCNNMIDDYKSFLSCERVYVLDVPAYYNGVPAFRSGFRPTMNFKYGIPLEKIRFITGSYHDTASDSLTSVIMDSGFVKVTGPKRNAPYFSTDGGQAKSYETDEFKVSFDSLRCSYQIQFKKPVPANSAFIYPSGKKWKKLELAAQ